MISFNKILKSDFKTNDYALFCIHKDDENLWHMVYQIISVYFENDYAYELKKNLYLQQSLKIKHWFPIQLIQILTGWATFYQFYDIMHRLRKVMYVVRNPSLFLLDLYSTLLDIYGQ